MENKIIQVFYGTDCLPYKDKECKVHYPIAGSVFLGASETTKIRFYYENIGTSSNTFVCEAKRGDGKVGSQVLSKSSDSDGNYAELSLGTWFTQVKGDLYLSLKSFAGGISVVEDDETGIYSIVGTPVIEATGAIKLSVNYTPIGAFANYNDEFTTYQQILALVGDKIDTAYGITTTQNIRTEVASDYPLGAVLYDTQERSFYLVNYQEGTQTKQFLKIGDYYTKDELDNWFDEYDIALAEKQPLLVSGQNIKTINGQSILGSGDLQIIAGVSSVNGKTGVVVLTANDIKLTTDNTTVQENISSIKLNLSRIELKYDNLIPSTASALNQLADKAFVNSSIATNTANYIYKLVGGEKKPFDSLQELENQTALTPTLNDYAFVVSTDSSGNTIYNRYKYTSGGWAFEYQLNNTSFTALQWASINSGITENKVAQYDGYNTLISTLNNRVDTLQSSITKSGIETLLVETWEQVEIEEE